MGLGFDKMSTKLLDLDLYNRNLPNCSWISHGFLMDFSWISHGFLMDFSWISHGFLTEFSILKEERDGGKGARRV